MRVELVLNTKAEGYAALKTDLVSEIGALEVKGIQIRSESAPPPPGTLFEDQVFRFVVEHGDKILDAVIARAMIELVRAGIQRLGIRVNKKSPPAILISDGKSLPLPSPPDKEKEFVKGLTTGTPNNTKPRPLNLRTQRPKAKPTRPKRKRSRRRKTKGTHS